MITGGRFPVKIPNLNSWRFPTVPFLILLRAELRESGWVSWGAPYRSVMSRHGKVSSPSSSGAVGSLSPPCPSKPGRLKLDEKLISGETQSDSCLSATYWCWSHFSFRVFLDITWACVKSRYHWRKRHTSILFTISIPRNKWDIPFCLSILRKCRHLRHGVLGFPIWRPSIAELWCIQYPWTGWLAPEFLEHPIYIYIYTHVYLYLAI